ncbi:MAG TPA: hypothetical protein VFS64_00065 [Solirubrobacterales bacterium]|nr:hypothetical protein [Solirubrobacterales bacterium]
MEASLDLEDRELFQRGVTLLRGFASPPNKILGPNFGVAIAVLIHRGLGGARGESAPPELIFRPDSGGPIGTKDLQAAVCDATFEKDVAHLPVHAEGPIYKPFTDHFKPTSANNWRNSFDLQGGLGCDAPYTADFLRSPEYLGERRVYCPYRDPASGHCHSPGGPGGKPTCFNPNKRDVPPGPGTSALDRPKLLSRGPRANRGFWYVEPTADVLAGLLAAPDNRVPLYPWMAAMYGGSAYFKQWGVEISRSRFEADLQLDSARFLTLFDPDPESPWNSLLLSGEGTIVGDDPGTDAAGDRPHGGVDENDEPLEDGQPLSTPVPFQSRDIGRLVSQADSSPDPARRARLLERARRGHQRALEELASAITRRGDFELTEQLDGYDLLAVHGDTGHLFEVKSWSPGNLAGQIRRGWAQLREYRYRNRRRLPSDVRLYLVLDRPPPRGLWIWPFLVGDCDVIPAWMEEGEIATLPDLVGLLP